MHPYDGKWFGWLSKLWYSVTCGDFRCQVCRYGTSDCTRHECSDIRHMIESRILTRTTEGS